MITSVAMCNPVVITAHIKDAYERQLVSGLQAVNFDGRIAVLNKKAQPVTPLGVGKYAPVFDADQSGLTTCNIAKCLPNAQDLSGQALVTFIMERPTPQISLTASNSGASATSAVSVINLPNHQYSPGIQWAEFGNKNKPYDDDVATSAVGETRTSNYYQPGTYTLGGWLSRTTLPVQSQDYPSHVKNLIGVALQPEAKRVDRDLTALTGGPQAENGSGLSSYADTAGEHAYYVSVDHHAHQFYYNNGWVDQDLTALTGGPQVANGSGLSTYADNNGEHAYFVGDDQHIHQLYYNNGWIDQDLSALTGGPQVANGSGLSSYADKTGEHADYVGNDQHIHQLYYNNGWVDQDLTALTKGPEVTNGTGLSSYADNAGEHAYYVGVDHHVHQLYYNNGWIDQNLTALTKGPDAVNGSGLSSYADNAGEHADYIGVDHHVHQLYYNNGWVDQDLTALTGGHQVANGSGLSSYADSAGQYAYYLDSDQHVHQLYF